MDRFLDLLDISPAEEAEIVGKYYEGYLHMLYDPSVFHFLLILYIYARLLLAWTRYNDSMLYTCIGCALVIDAVYISVYNWALHNIISDNWIMASVIFCLCMVVNIPLFRGGRFLVTKVQNIIA